jgi:hypothetical protein
MEGTGITPELLGYRNEVWFELLLYHYEQGGTLKSLNALISMLKRKPFYINQLPESGASLLYYFRKMGGPVCTRGGSPQRLKDIVCPLINLTATISYGSLPEILIKICQNERLGKFWNWESEPMYSGEGKKRERVYDEFNSGQWLEQAYIVMRAKFGDDIKVGGIIVSGDGIAVNASLAKTIKQVIKT